MDFEKLYEAEKKKREMFEKKCLTLMMASRQKGIKDLSGTEIEPVAVYKQKEIISSFTSTQDNVQKQFASFQTQLAQMQENLLQTLQQQQNQFQKNTVDSTKPPIDVEEYTKQIEECYTTCLYKLENELKQKTGESEKLIQKVEQLEKNLVLITEKGLQHKQHTPRNHLNLQSQQQQQHTPRSILSPRTPRVIDVPVTPRLVPKIALEKLDESQLANHKMAVIIQRRVRARSARKKLQKLVTDYKDSPFAKMMRHRNQIITEIVNTEKGYVESMHLVVNLYIKPLQEDCKKQGLSRKELMPFMQSVFMNISQIYSLHQLFLLTLETRLQNWPRVLIGDCFLNQAPLFLFYIKYVNGYDNAINTLREMKKKNPKFLKFYNEGKGHKDAANQNLDSLLIKVIQRLPRYSLLLRELLKHTPTTHVDYDNLNQALGRINAITGTINQKKAEFETNNIVDKMMEKNIFSDIAKRDEKRETRHSVSVSKSDLMQDLEFSRKDQTTLWLELFDENNKPRRKFLREIDARIVSTGREDREIDVHGHLYLFEGLLILTKPEQKKIDVLTNKLVTNNIFKRVGTTRRVIVNNIEKQVEKATGNQSDVKNLVGNILNPERVVGTAVETVSHVVSDMKYELEAIIYLDNTNSTIFIPDIAAKKMIPKKLYETEERWFHMQVENKVMYSISIERDSPVVDPQTEWKKALEKLLNNQSDDDEDDNDVHREETEKMKELMKTYMKILGDDEQQLSTTTGEKRSSRK